MTRFLERRPFTLSATCLALLALASACSQEAPDTRAVDESAIRSADAQWSKIAATKDLDATVAFYSEDATVLPPNAPVAATRAAIRAMWATLIAPGVEVSWQATKVEVARSGDLGYLLGTYTVTAKDAQGKPVTDTGKIVEVWKKQSDGKWKCVADTYNSDLPVAPAERVK